MGGYVIQRAQVAKPGAKPPEPQFFSLYGWVKLPRQALRFSNQRDAASWVLEERKRGNPAIGTEDHPIVPYKETQEDLERISGGQPLSVVSEFDPFKAERG